MLSRVLLWKIQNMFNTVPLSKRICSLHCIWCILGSSFPHLTLLDISALLLDAVAVNLLRRVKLFFINKIEIFSFTDTSNRRFHLDRRCGRTMRRYWIYSLHWPVYIILVFLRESIHQIFRFGSIYCVMWFSECDSCFQGIRRSSLDVLFV